MIDLKKRDYWTQYVPFMNSESEAPFAEVSFQHYVVKTHSGSIKVKSMLASYELSILFALAKDYWSGEGHIVDLGCLYGLTTRCFAEGVKLNEFVAEDLKRKRIFAYDLFLAEAYEWWVQGAEILEGGSFFCDFERLNHNEMHYIVPCPGDLLRMNWGISPIEILMIDCAKTWELNHFIVSRMFPRLIPGKSVVIQQDYMHYNEYWIAISMEFFSDYFSPLDFVYGASGLFLASKQIPSEVASFDLSTLSAQEKIRLMDQAISKAPRSGAEVLKTAKAKLLLDLDMSSEAEKLISSVVIDRLATESYDDFSGIAESCVSSVRDLILNRDISSGS